MDIEVRALSIAEYEKYLEMLDELTEKVNKKELTPRTFALSIAKWIGTEIYGLDMETIKPGTLFDLSDKTVKLTEESEIKDEKNSVTSGIGESKVE